MGNRYKEVEETTELWLIRLQNVCNTERHIAINFIDFCNKVSERGYSITYSDTFKKIYWDNKGSGLSG